MFKVLRVRDYKYQVVLWGISINLSLPPRPSGHYVRGYELEDLEKMLSSSLLDMT